MSQSLGRALLILDELGGGPRSLDELAGTLEVHKTTVLRLLRTLEASRFVRHDSQHHYSLGSRLFALGSAALEQHAVRDVAHPHLVDLARGIGGHTVHLAVREGAAAIYIDKIESTGSVRMYSRVGLPAPLHATAVGKVLTCELPARVLDGLVEQMDFQPFTQRTITDPDAFREALARVRQRGWAEDAEEHEDFINCIGAPVRDASGRIVAAVSISVPEVVRDHDGVQALLPRLLETTTEIGRSWAGAPEPERTNR